jgi:adenine-specific DNA methylase
MLMALLLPDPCDPYCPGAFKEKARKLLPSLCGTIGETDYDLQRKLLHFIADFANWDNAHRKEYLELSRALIKAAHPEETPLVVDPFAGGGSIPLEALRIGCDAFASDLNPVACLILKVMLEDIPKSGPELIDQLREVGNRIINKAKDELKEYYPDDPDGSKPVAYIWARTVRCESPDCGAEIPLMRSFWLCNKAKKKVALKPIVKRIEGDVPSVEFEIFEPKKESEVHVPTVTRAKATCLCCGSVLPPDRVRSQLAKQNGGADVIFDQNGIRIGGARMLAVVLTKEDIPGRLYRLTSDDDYQPVFAASQDVARVMGEWESKGKQGLCPFPDEPTPAGGGSGAGRAFSVQKYGMYSHFDLYNKRQLIMSHIIGKLVRISKGSINDILTIAHGTFLRSNNTNTRLRPDSSVAPAFGMQTMPMNWSWPETVLTGGRSENFDGAIRNLLEIVSTLKATIETHGHVTQQDAIALNIPN